MKLTVFSVNISLFLAGQIDLGERSRIRVTVRVTVRVKVGESERNFNFDCGNLVDSMKHGHAAWV